MKLLQAISALLVLLGSTSAAQVPVPGDVNGDGVVNVADHAYVQAILQRRLAATAAADVDGDGAVTERDATAVADLILGQPPFLYQGSGEIPQTGGECSAGDLSLAAAAGTLPETARIVVTAATTAPPYEGDDDSPLFRIEGVPTRYGAGLTVSLPLASPGRQRPREGTVFLELGEEVAPTSRIEPYLALRLVAARVEGDRLIADLPPLDLPAPDRDEDVPATQTVLVRRVTGVAVDAGEVLPEEEGGRAGVPLQIYFPSEMTKAQYQPVIDALSVANIRLKQLGFSPSDRTRPVEVYIKKLPPAICGYYVPSGWGVDYSSLEINTSYVIDAAQRLALQQTAFHEYFHMIQARFDPRNAFSQTKAIAPTLWFDEACSVWFEKMAPAAGGALSSMLNQHAHEVLAGHHVDSSGLAFLNQASATSAQNHGYGMATMLEFLFSHPDAPAQTLGKANPTLVQIYTAIRGGTAMRQAFLDNVPPVTQWWDKMLAAFVKDTIGKLAFHSSITQPGARATRVKLMPENKGENTLLLSAPSLGDCESWAFSLNWQETGAKSKRRLILETAAPDNAVHPVAFHSRRSGNSFAADGRLFGKYGDSYVSWIALPMEQSVDGGPIRPLHYLLFRHFGDPPASKAAHTTRAWYVDAERKVQTTAMALDTIVEPKLIAYSATGTATCEDPYFTYESVVYTDNTLTKEAARGGAGFLVPPTDDAFDIDIDVNIVGEIAEGSFYKITRYRLRVHYYNKNGETREQILGTYAAPTASISRTITLGPDDKRVSVSVYADEELKPDAPPNKIYSLRSWFYIASAHRYEEHLVIRYGAKAGGRETETPVPSTRFQTVLRQKDGTLKTADATVHFGLGSTPDGAGQPE